MILKTAVAASVQPHLPQKCNQETNDADVICKY